jgi:hypothetical protein
MYSLRIKIAITAVVFIALVTSGCIFDAPDEEEVFDAEEGDVGLYIELSSDELVFSKSEINVMYSLENKLNKRLLLGYKNYSIKLTHLEDYYEVERNITEDYQKLILKPEENRSFNLITIDSKLLDLKKNTKERYGLYSVQAFYNGNIYLESNIAYILVKDK